MRLMSCAQPASSATHNRMRHAQCRQRLCISHSALTSARARTCSAKRAMKSHETNAAAHDKHACWISRSLRSYQHRQAGRINLFRPAFCIAVHSKHQISSLPFAFTAGAAPISAIRQRRWKLKANETCRAHASMPKATKKAVFLAPPSEMWICASFFSMIHSKPVSTWSIKVMPLSYK